jgi:hypothetical protein
MSDVAPDCVLANAALVEAYTIYQSKTTVKISGRRRCRLDDQLVMIGLAESLRAAAVVADKGKETVVERGGVRG